jgi:MoaA/NifB/PqqE/SkfB family radical SAM enzyme
MGWMTTIEAARRLPALLIRGRVAFTFDGIPLRTRRLGLRRRWNLVQTGLDRVLRRSRLRGLPPIVHFEPANYCNLRCPLCPTGAGKMPRAPERMTMETFERALSELAGTLVYAYFFSFGEPFLNPDLPLMIRACTDRGINTLSSTNGHWVGTPEDAERIVDSGLTTLIIAVDGSTQEIYETYRAGGDLETVKSSIRMIEEAKARRGSKTPYTVIRCVVNNRNAADLPALERLAADLGVDLFATKDLGCLVRSDQYGGFVPDQPEFSRFSPDRKRRRPKKEPFCIFPFRQPVVHNDGTLIGCEYDLDRSKAFGNAARDSFRLIWNSPNAVSLRRAIHRGETDGLFCRDCPFRGRVRDGVEISITSFRRMPR